MSGVRVGEEINVYSKGGWGGYFEAEGVVAHIFKAGIKPDPENVYKYYGEEPPKDVFKGSRYDRIVIHKGGGHYYIVPYSTSYEFY